MQFYTHLFKITLYGTWLQRRWYCPKLRLTANVMRSSATAIDVNRSLEILAADVFKAVLTA